MSKVSGDKTFWFSVGILHCLFKYILLFSFFPMTFKKLISCKFRYTIMTLCEMHAYHIKSCIIS